MDDAKDRKMFSCRTEPLRRRKWPLVMVAIAEVIMTVLLPLVTPRCSAQMTSFVPMSLDGVAPPPFQTFQSPHFMPILQKATDVRPDHVMKKLRGGGGSFFLG